MSETQALVPTTVRTIDFYGDEVLGALVPVDDEPRLYVPVRPLCDYLGLAWSGQYERIKRDEVLAEALLGIRITRTPAQGGSQEMLCLPLDLLPGWLFGISANRVKAELRDKIVRYKRECYRRLWDAFKHEILPADEPTLRPVPMAGAQLAYELATAVQNLAREQMEFEQNVNSRFERAGQWARGIEVRVTALEVIEGRVAALERRSNPATPISEGQRAELQLAVKNVGYALEQRGSVPGYPRVYGELYRRYAISSYKALPQGTFNEAIEWLHAWYVELTADQGDKST